MSGAYKYSPQHTQNELGYSPEEPMATTTALEDLRALEKMLLPFQDDIAILSVLVKVQPIIEKLERETVIPSQDKLKGGCDVLSQIRGWISRCRIPTAPIEQPSARELETFIECLYHDYRRALASREGK